jgi:FAD/FMN-containing dehydrogenase
MIDLSGLKAIRVDPVRRTVRAEPGVLWGEFDRETQAFGLGTTGGVVSTTGIAGLTLGGGVGWLVRKHGLACDNLVSVDIVTADGKLRTASADEHRDLFWGVRGGGGNFGIVTSFEYRSSSQRRCAEDRSSWTLVREAARRWATATRPLAPGYCRPAVEPDATSCGR